MSSSAGDSSRPVSPSSRPGLSRRRLVAGAAWAAPVVVASSVIPAYAASDEEGECTGPYEDSTMITAGDGVKKVAVLTVPAGAKRMRFTAVGVPVARTTLWLMPVPVPWWRVLWLCAAARLLL